MEKRVTVKEVAETAGVSRTTVSRVINNFPYIKNSTKKKVMEAIDTLGYEPDQIARSLIKQKTRIIGLIIDDISDSFFAETAKVIIKKARIFNYDLIIYDTKNEDIHLVLRKLQEKRVSGVLIGSIYRNNKTINLEEFEFPIFLFNCDIDHSSLYSIMVDNKQGAFLAIQHLFKLGHRRIAFISGPLTHTTYYERFIGYVHSLEHYGIIYDHQLVYSGKHTYGNLYEFVKNILSIPIKPTSFFVSSDQMAIDVLDAVSRQGLHIPKDISVIGFGDIDISSNPYIGLTTISNKKTELSSQAIKELIELIEGHSLLKRPVKTKMEPALIIRKTTSKIEIKDST